MITIAKVIINQPHRERQLITLERLLTFNAYLQATY